MKRLVGLAAAAMISLSFGACGSGSGGGASPSGDGGGDELPSVTAGDSGTGADGSLDGSGGDSSVRDSGRPDVSVSNAPCTTTFRFVPPSGTSAKTVSVTGEWNGFANPGNPMTGPDSSGAFSAQVQLQPGTLVAYKFIVDGNWELDPNEHWQKYVGGVANSAVQVAFCHAPTLVLKTNAVTRPSAGQGHYTATIAFQAGQGAPPIDPASVQATLRKDGQSSAIKGVTVSAAQSTIALDVPALADGKYTAFVQAKDLAGQSTQDLRLVFWVEASPFTWQDSLIYMAMTDRFKDGDTSNDAPPTPSTDPRVDWHGGDYKGIEAKVADGTLDKLGVTVLWVSPFYTQPPDTWPASDGAHQVTGYHGYWPIKAREVEPRFGGEAELHSLITTAHAHGIRVLMDLVVQHVHQEHEYLAQHPTWFNTTGCICGTNNCDWTVHRLDCLFASYLPNIDWTNPEGDAQWEADAVWWMDTFDLDGFRVDAVKQVPDIAVINLTSALHDEFDPSGLAPVYTIGETAMGWVDDNLQDNLSQYQLISEYVNDGLTGQFDFVLYYADPMHVFVWQDYGLDHADQWVRYSGEEYPQGAIMGPYVGSEDTARFITIASYRNQSSQWSSSIPYNQWSNIAGAPPDSETYGRHRDAMGWLLGLPGAPLVYYGDEYGQFGGVDPNNRVDWRGDSPASDPLTGDEQATLAFVRKAGMARKSLVAMRRGAYVPVYNTDVNTTVFARQTTAGDVALEAINRQDVPASITTGLPPSLALKNGTTLHDHMGGADVQVSGGSITVNLPAQGIAILAP